jgi:hypothetical protein
MKPFLFTLVLAAPGMLFGDIVVRGTDYLSIQSGSQATLAPFGVIQFIGNPIGPGNTSLIIQRQADAQINGAAIPVEVTAVSMMSTAPVTFQGSTYDLFVTLDPGHLGQNGGTMSIAGTTLGGTFTTSMDVWVLLHAVSTINPSDTLNSVRQATISSSSALWSPTPPAGTAIVPGPHDGSAQDYLANLHSGLSAEELDFFAPNYTFNFVGSAGATGEILATPAVPEPGVWSLLLFPATYAVVTVRRRKRQQNSAA